MREDKELEQDIVQKLGTVGYPQMPDCVLEYFDTSFNDWVGPEYVELPNRFLTVCVTVCAGNPTSRFC